MSDELVLEVALAGRGNAVSIDGDGEMVLRLAVAPQYRKQVLALVDVLSQGQTVRLVAVQ